MGSHRLRIVALLNAKGRQHVSQLAREIGISRPLLHLPAARPLAVCLHADDPDLAWQVRLRDRFCDNYLHAQMQKLAGDNLRPPGKKDPYGVADCALMARPSYARALTQAKPFLHLLPK